MKRPGPHLPERKGDQGRASTELRGCVGAVGVGVRACDRGRTTALEEAAGAHGTWEGGGCSTAEGWGAARRGCRGNSTTAPQRSRQAHGGGGGGVLPLAVRAPPPSPSPSPSPFPQRRGSVGSGWSGRRKGTLSTCDRDGTSPWHMHIRTDLRWEQWVYAKVRL